MRIFYEKQLRLDTRLHGHEIRVARSLSEAGIPIVSLSRERGNLLGLE